MNLPGVVYGISFRFGFRVTDGAATGWATAALGNGDVESRIFVAASTDVRFVLILLK